MFLKNSLRIVILLALMSAVGLLFYRYKVLQREKLSLIMLASIYPFNGGGNQVLPEEIFRRYATTENPDGFFQLQKCHGKLADAGDSLVIAERRMRSFIPANLDSIMWGEKSIPKAFGFHEARVEIPQKDIDNFLGATAQYIAAFREVLKQDRWMARIDRPEVKHADSIKIDVAAVARDLELFSEQFRQRDRILIDNVPFNLTNITAFELFVILENIKWHRQQIKGAYITVFRASHKQWLDTVESKFKR